MDTLDTYYRALLELRKLTKNERSCKAQRNAIKASNVENDLLQSTNYIIDVDLEWVEAIENSLDAIAKCIAEGRQFIRRNGEITKIEKVKSVSKESVEHLSRHSNLIKRNNGEDIIPDELYTVEKLSDYAVYENRFLYMLLCYTRDFITLRYDKIVEFSNKYSSTIKMKKQVHVGNRIINYNVDFNEEINNDEYKQRNNNITIIERIKNVLTAILAYINTPLMAQVAKVPMVKPPITKTNVLKMNQNFIVAVNLYNYITTYDKKGYTIKEEVKKLNPLSSEMADVYAEIVELYSFLNYQYCNNIEKDLKEKFDLIEAKRKEEDDIKHQQKLKLLKKKVLESGLNIEEYTLELEKRNKILEKNSELLTKANEDIIKLNENIDDLNNRNVELATSNTELSKTIKQKEIDFNNMILAYDKKIEEINLNHKQEIEELNLIHKQEIDELIINHQKEIEELTTSYEEKINSLNQEHEYEVKKLHEDYNNRINDLNIQHEEKIKSLIADHGKEINELNNEKQKITNRYEEKITNLNQNINDLNQDIKLKEEKVNDITKLNNIQHDEKLILLAELNAIRVKDNKEVLDAIDFTNEERFKELEEEYKVFKKMFGKEWQKTKKTIYKELKEKYLGKSKEK